jgi:hypothetical protein
MIEAMPNKETYERVEKILADMAAILDRASENSVDKLRSFVALEPKEGQAYATLELMSNQNYCLTYNRFFIKEENGKKILDTEWASDGTDSAESFIPELDTYAAKVFDGVDYSEEEMADFGPRQSKQLYEWFSKCWKIAGGEHARTPTFFAMNKEYMCQDLTTGEIMTEEAAARKLGHDVPELN